jgi:hypothetical protein
VDARAAAPKGGVRRWLYGERHGSMVAFLFCHVDGVERRVGDPGVGSALALAAPRWRFGDLTRERWTAEFLKAVQGFFWAKGQRLGANSDDACGCRYPLGGVVVVIGDIPNRYTSDVVLNQQARMAHQGWYGGFAIPGGPVAEVATAVLDPGAYGGSGDRPMAD